MPGSRPNILWILTTQWRGQATGIAGDSNARTPFLDALAKRGTWFRSAVTPHPFGPFARAAILTGVPSPQNGVAGYWDPLPEDAHTIAHSMRSLGYRTAWFGKWHLGERDRLAPLVGEPHARQVVPETRRGGFEFWEGFESGFLLNDPWLHGTRLPEPRQFFGYQSEILAARAAEWLSGLPVGGPWFCVVSLEAPHPPYDAPASGGTRRDPSALILGPAVPRGGDVELRARRELAGYHAHIEATDAAIGRLSGSLPDDTIIVVTSVHGDMHGAHGLFRKGWPHDESIRVPLVVHGGSFADASSIAVPSLIDLPSMTLAWAAGKAWAPKNGDAARVSMPSVVELPLQCDRRWRGVRTADWMLALNDDGSPWLLFDMNTDPGQLLNRAEDQDFAPVIRELGRLV